MALWLLRSLEVDIGEMRAVWWFWGKQIWSIVSFVLYCNLISDIYVDLEEMLVLRTNVIQKYF